MRRLARVAAVLLVIAAAAGAVFYINPLWVSDQQIHLHLWRQGVRSEYVEAGGYHMHFYEAEPTNGGAGVPLVLIHGLGGRAEDWSPMIPTLAAQGFHVYAPDLPGYGRTSKPDVDYTIALEEKAVVKFMQAVHVSGADVGGWSMGGWIAAQLAIDHPAMVERLVLYDSAGLRYDVNFAPGIFTPSTPEGLQQLITILSPIRRSLPGFVVRASIRKLQRGGWVVNRSLAAMLSGRDLLDGRLGSITQPTLIVWGREDRLIPVSVAYALHRGISQSVLETVEGCGHLAPAECAKPVLSGTVEFLKAEPPMRSFEKRFPAPN